MPIDLLFPKTKTGPMDLLAPKSNNNPQPTTSKFDAQLEQNANSAPLGWLGSALIKYIANPAAKFIARPQDFILPGAAGESLKNVGSDTLNLGFLGAAQKHTQEITQGTRPTPLQTAGGALEGALNVASLIPVVSAAKGAIEGAGPLGALAGLKRGLVGGLKFGAKVAGPIGAGYGVANEMQSNNPSIAGGILNAGLGYGAGVLGSTILGGAGGAIKGAIAKGSMSYDQALNESESNLRDLFDPGQKVIQKEYKTGNNPFRTIAQETGANGITTFEQAGKNRINTEGAVESISPKYERVNNTLQKVYDASDKYVDFDLFAKTAEDKLNQSLRGNDLVQAGGRVLDDLASRKEQLLNSGEAFMDANGKTMIPVGKLNQIKSDLWAKVGGKFDQPWQKVLSDANYHAGNAAKDIIEQQFADQVDIANLNKYSGELKGAIKYLTDKNGAPVPGGGKVSRFANRALGAIIGSHGGPVTAAAGAWTADKLAEVLYSPMSSFESSQAILNKLKTDLGEQAANKLIQEAENYVTQNLTERASRLKLSAPEAIYGQPWKGGQGGFNSWNNINQTTGRPKSGGLFEYLQNKAASDKAAGIYPKNKLLEDTNRKQGTMVTPLKQVDSASPKGLGTATPKNASIGPNKGLGSMTPQEPVSSILRGTKGMTADDIMKKHPNIKLTKDVAAKDVYGNKVIIPDGEKLTPYEMKDGKILLQDGETYLVSKNQFQNIKGNTIGGEAKPFAPELDTLKESVKKSDKNKWIIRDKEHGTVIDEFGDEQSAEKELRKYELSDKKEGIFEKNFYEIINNSQTKFSQYTLPNGENYREVIHKDPRFLVKLDSSHFGDAASWHRATERTYKGKKVYFVEEIQKGKYLDETVGHPLGKGKYIKAEVQDSLKKAVDEGADIYAWINGEQTSARYNLATQVDEVKWTPNKANNVRNIDIKPKSGSYIKISINSDGVIGSAYGKSEWEGKKLDEVLGKGLADKIMAKESGTLSGEGLKFGGEWANNLYDKQVKNIVEDLTGQKVEIIKLNTGNERQVAQAEKGIGKKENILTEQMAIKLTPEVKAKIRGEATEIKTSGKLYE